MPQFESCRVATLSRSLRTMRWGGVFLAQV
jgi:hypothetical protein